MAGPRHWPLGVLAVCHLLAPQAVAKTVMGIARGTDYQLVSKFCFTFPRPVPGVEQQNGHIHSQTIVASDGHKFLVVNASDLELGLPCTELVRRAKVVEPLTERTQEVIAYDLTLNVEPSMDHQHIAAVIARCDAAVSAEYIVEFASPGGYLEQQFSCADQGLLSTYIGLSILAAALAPFFYSTLRVLSRRQVHNDISALFFTAAAFSATRVWLFTLHLLVYSHNGLGLGMLLFLAQFLDFVSSTMAMLVLVALVHGVYVTRPNVPVGSDERTMLLRVTAAFVATYLFSTLACGFKVDSGLVPFGVLRSSASWPYVLVRAVCALFCLQRGLAVAREVATQQKKHSILRFSLLATVWLAAMPLIMMFSSDDSWHHDACALEASNFGLFGVLLYDFWPSRYGALFSCMKPTERMHPYSEFGLTD